MRLVKARLALIDADHLYSTATVVGATEQWEGKIVSLSPITRKATLDRTFERGGCTLVIADSDGALQAMMADDTSRRIYGRTVTLYCYQRDGVTLADTVTMTINGWSRVVVTVDNKETEAVSFDLVQEFAGAAFAIPEEQALTITAATFPEAAGRAIGQPVPMPTGVCYATHGKVRAWKVVNRNVGAGIDRKYLLTWSDPTGDPRVTSIDTVLENDVRVTPASNYALTRDANGWEYCEYNGTEQYIAVNLTAVSAPGQTGANPVAALRAILLGAGVTLVDDGDGGTSDFEDFCDANTWTIGGVPEGGCTLVDYLETWCQNFDCFWRVDSAGAVHIYHLDWATVTAVASLNEHHLLACSESADMSGYANRMRSKWDYGNAAWNAETLTGVDAVADYPSTVFVKEASEEYLLGAFGGVTNPVESKLRWLATVRQTVAGLVDLYQWEQLGASLLKAVNVSHYRQIGGAGVYLILSESTDYIGGTVQFEAVRLWGVS